MFKIPNVNKIKIEYIIHGFLCELKTFSYLGGYKLKNNFANIEQEIENYKKAISSLDHSFILYNDGRQYYSREFSLDNDFKYWYKMHWDINKAQEIINAKKISIYQFEVEKLHEQVDVKDLDSKKLKKADNSSPIIVAEYDPLNMPIVIDGNHRLHNAYKKRQKYINGYCLDPVVQQEAMPSELLKVLFRIHHNIGVISNYVLGNIERIEYSEEGYNYCLYSIS